MFGLKKYLETIIVPPVISKTKNKSKTLIDFDSQISDLNNLLDQSQQLPRSDKISNPVSDDTPHIEDPKQIDKSQNMIPIYLKDESIMTKQNTDKYMDEPVAPINTDTIDDVVNPESVKPINNDVNNIVPSSNKVQPNKDRRSDPVNLILDDIDTQIMALETEFKADLDCDKKNK
ncbi:MAG: hypothetical protein KAI18_03700 [Candidatus Aenigmarchaeota archaeon]|nr:hypothetical protein [Candidatus Aenigmarchaeota archaeon]